MTGAAIPEPGLRPLCRLRITLGDPIELGRTARGIRRIIPITGGSVEGARLSGRILAFGADWQTILADGTAELDARYILETDDGARIDVRNWGLRHGPPEILAALARGEAVDPAHYYMRTHPRFETGDERYAWLNRGLFVGSGRRDADAVHLSFFELV
ncbi:MAG: UPF0311 protein [Paracoccaceae bacterium]|nr:MAG: UPF0311 protein [Paracoccaceae bacterium]